MAISMDNLPAAEGGFKVTRDMIERWCAAYDDERLPDGYAFDGPIKPGERAAQPQGRPWTASALKPDKRAGLRAERSVRADGGRKARQEKGEKGGERR